MEVVGKVVKKSFEGFGVYTGVVKSYDHSTGFFKVVYEDGDSEDLEFGQVSSLVDGGVEDILVEQIGPERRGKAKKRRREEGCDELGNSMDVEMRDSDSGEGFEETLVMDDGDHVESCETLENEGGSLEKSDFVDDSLKENGSVEVDEGNQMKHFDLGGELKEGVNSKRFEETTEDCDLGGNFRGNVSGRVLEETHGKEFGFVGDSNRSAPSGSFDGNVNENAFNRVVEESHMNGGAFGEDLKENTSPEDAKETQKKDSASSGGGEDLKENVSLGDMREIQKKDMSIVEDFIGGATSEAVEGSQIKDSGSVESQLKEAGSEADFIETKGTLSVATPDKEGPGLRKRRKLSGKLESTPETSLRRSARRATANLLPSPNPVSGTELSPAIDAVLVDGKCESKEELGGLPPKVALPPSSGNLNLDEIPILDLFSVYSCLRSFSTLLFLSPFSLEAFVAALKCDFANSLIDSIHLSILQALKVHLEFLSREGSQPASDCLRSLNWEFLDLITWPVYLVEYLLVHGSISKLGFQLPHLKLLRGEYYGQTSVVKLEILRCLCDDVMESEVIRSDLERRRRSLAPEMDTDQIANIESNSKRRDSVDDLGGSCLTQEGVEEVADRNSDECCICKMDGSLICCDGCPAAYHLRCVGMAKDLLPEGEWYCLECTMEKHDGWKKSLNTLRGAELLGIDPHGRSYFGCFGYLLVCDSCGTESSYQYYNSNGLSAVVEVLKSSDISYSGIRSAISMYWNLPVHFGGEKSRCNQITRTVLIDLDKDTKIHGGNMSHFSLPHSTRNLAKEEHVDETKPQENSAIPVDNCHQSCDVSETRPNSITINQSVEVVNSECLSEISQATPCIMKSQKNESDCSMKSGSPKELYIPPKMHSYGQEFVQEPTDLAAAQEKQVMSPVPNSTSLGTNLQNCGTSEVLSEPGDYINYYSFGHTALSVAEELARISSDMVKKDPSRSVEDIISAQLKAVSKKPMKFSWSSIQRLHADAQKENCGWCLSCKTPTEGSCLFNVTDQKVSESSKAGVVGPSSKKKRKSHLTYVVHYILSMEDRLRGLLSGPWENPHYSKMWRKSVLKASDVSSIKPLLLMLESNLRRLALSADWMKLVDSAAIVGSASHILITSAHVSSKHGAGRKRARKNIPDAESNPVSNTGTTSGIYWWRGGRLSRQVFLWKVLPRSLASMGGRQAGCRKIPGICYPDGSEIARRSKYIAWRVAVEMSTSVAQLACQVRDLGSNIRWDDLADTQFLSQWTKESKKLARPLKKVTIRKKCIEGTEVKYLVDFGKRKTVPDTVIKHGVMLEEPSSERKKYWLNQSYVPLKLLKDFEEKKISHAIDKTNSGSLHVEGAKRKNLRRQKGLSHLLSRTEKIENHQCGHCNKVVPASEAVNCRFCNGFFHQSHVRLCKGTPTTEQMYVCYICQEKKEVKKKTKSLKAQEEKTEVSTERRSGRLLKKVTSVSVSAKRKKPEGSNISSSAKRKKVPGCKISLPLKCKRLNKGKGGKRFQSKGGTTKKLRNGITWHTGHRTRVYHAYWLNGLLWTSKPNDKRGAHFRGKKVIVPSGRPKRGLAKPICCLCHEAYDSELIYVGCENCGDWFHGDSFGVTIENSTNLLGFRCHNCLKRKTLVCLHSKHVELNEVKFCEEKTNCARVECEVAVDKKIEKEKCEIEESQAKKDCQEVVPTEVSAHEEQSLDVIPDSSEILKSEQHKEKYFCTETEYDVSTDNKLPSETCEREESLPEEDCTGLFHINEHLHKELDMTPDPGQIVLLEECKETNYSAGTEHDVSTYNRLMGEKCEKVQSPPKVNCSVFHTFELVHKEGSMSVTSDSAQIRMLEEQKEDSEKISIMSGSHELDEAK